VNEVWLSANLQQLAINGTRGAPQDSLFQWKLQKKFYHFNRYELGFLT